jgi:spermidine synthase
VLTCLTHRPLRRHPGQPAGAGNLSGESVFTAGFFELAKNHLAPGGVFSFGIDGVANYISPAQQQKLSSLANTAGTIFRMSCSCRGSGCCLSAVTGRFDRHSASSGTKGNRDPPYPPLFCRRPDRSADPSTQRRRGCRHRAKPGSVSTADAAGVRWMVCAPWRVAALVRLVLSQRRWLPVRITRPQWVLLTTGCVNIGAEMVTIFTFQALYGYIYLQLGVLVTVFLAGLLPGAWAGGRFAGNRRRALMTGDLLLCLLLVMFALILVVCRQTDAAGCYTASAWQSPFAADSSFRWPSRCPGAVPPPPRKVFQRTWWARPSASCW